MIYGIGTDLVEIDRLRQAFARHGQRLAERLLAPSERLMLEGLADPARYLAKRWAAKEAMAKALGTGVRPPVTLAGMAVVNDSLGKPTVEVDAAIAAFLAERGITRLHLSLSDEKGSVVAFAVAECVAGLAPGDSIRRIDAAQQA